MTAVEWLITELRKPYSDRYIEPIIQKAKEMEEKQRIMDYEMGYINGGNQKKITGEQYLNNLNK